MKFQTDNVDYRILVVGLQSAGKSSVLHMIVNREDILLHGDPVSTHGVEVVPFETASVNGKSVIFYEIGGNMSSRGLMNYYYDCEAVIYVIDSTKPAELTKEPYVEHKEKEKEQQEDTMKAKEEEEETMPMHTLKIPTSVSVDALFTSSFTKADTFTDEDENNPHLLPLDDDHESSRSSSSDTSLEEVASPFTPSCDEQTEQVQADDGANESEDEQIIHVQDEETNIHGADKQSTNTANVNSTNMNSKLLPANHREDGSKQNATNSSKSSKKLNLSSLMSKFEKLRSHRNRMIPLIKSQTTDAVDLVAMDDAVNHSTECMVITEDQEEGGGEEQDTHDQHRCGVSTQQRKSVSHCKVSKLLGMEEQHSQSSDNMLPSHQPMFGRSKSASAAVSRPSFSISLTDRTRLSMVGKFKRHKKVKTNKARGSVATTLSSSNREMLRAAAVETAKTRKLKPGSLFLQPLTMNEAKCHSAQELISKLNYEIKSVDVPFLIYYNKQDLVHRRLSGEEIEKRLEYETIINKTRRYSAFECGAADRERVYDGWNWLLQTLKEIKLKQKENAKFDELVNRLNSIDQDKYGPNAKRPHCVICSKPCKHTGRFCTVCGKWYCQADERKSMLHRRSGNSKCRQCVGQKSIFFQEKKKQPQAK